MRKLKLLGVAVAGLLLILFVLFNLNSVKVSFIFFAVEAPPSILVILSAILGAVVTLGVQLLLRSKK